MEKFFASLLKYLTGAIFVFIPLYPKFPAFFLGGSTVAVRAEDFLIALTTLVFVVNFFLRQKKKLPPLSLQIGAYLFIGLISSLSAIIITQNVSPLLVILHYFRRLEYLLLFFFAYYVGKDNSLNRRFLYELIVLPVIGVFFYGIAQIFFQAPVISTMNKEFAKGVALILQPGVQLSSTFAGHYDLAIYLAMILSYLTVLLTTVKKKLHHGLLIFAFILLLWLSAQAGSRIALFGLTFSVLLICSFQRRLKLGLLLITLIGLSVLTSPNLLMRLNNLLRVFEAKLQSAVVAKPVWAAVNDDGVVLATAAARPIEQDRSTSIRFDVEWPRAIRAATKNPFFGTGYSSITLATDNEYLRALGETGLLGLTAFLSLLLALGRKLFYLFRKAKNSLDKNIALGAFGVYCVFLISAVFLDVFEASKIAIMFWAYTGLAMSVES